MQQIQLMNSLDAIARVNAKDCFVRGESIVFLVPESQMRQAIGKNGSVVEKLKKMLGKNVELFEYNEDPKKFFEKAFYRAKINEIEISEKEGSKAATIKVDGTNKRIILQNMGRLKKIKELAERNYNIDEVRVR